MSPRASRLLATAPALLAGFLAFFLAWRTLLPGLYLWDTGELQTVGPLLGTGHPSGFPAWVILGWFASVALQPFGDPAYRMNLLSAILGGVAAGATVILVSRLTERRWVGLAAGLILATTPIAWQIANAADVHALHLALVAILLGLLVDWERRRTATDRDGLDHRADRSLVAAAFVFGIALANHNLALLLVPGISLFVLAAEPDIVHRRRFFFGCIAVAFLTTAVLYLELPLRAGIFRAPLVYGHPETLPGFLYVVLGAQFAGSITNPLAQVGDKVADLASVAGAQFGLLAWLIPVGLVATLARRRRYALLTVPSFLITCWFAESYTNAEIWRYLLGPALIAITWLAILAAEVVALLEQAADRAPTGSVLWSLGATVVDGVRERASMVFEVVLVAILLVPTALAIPARATAVDRSHDLTASTWLGGLLPKLAQTGVIISWWSYSTPLWYAQDIEGKIPGIAIVDDRTRLDEGLGSVSDVIDGNLGKRPVYLIREPADLAPLQQVYSMTLIDTTEPLQPVYEITGRINGQP
ncbi:MAG: protein O-mannosyl-transferase family [Candidatus Limnocylindrales bacterium]